MKDEASLRGLARTALWLRLTLWKTLRKLERGADVEGLDDFVEQVAAGIDGMVTDENADAVLEFLREQADAAEDLAEREALVGENRSEP